MVDAGPDTVAGLLVTRIPGCNALGKLLFRPCDGDDGRGRAAGPRGDHGGTKASGDCCCPRTPRPTSALLTIESIVMIVVPMRKNGS